MRGRDVVEDVLTNTIEKVVVKKKKTKQSSGCRHHGVFILCGPVQHGHFNFSNAKIGDEKSMAYPIPDY